MARRKGKGTNGRGSIFQDKNGKWWAQLPPDALGKRPKRGAATEREAITLLRQLERDRAQRLDTSKRRKTLEQVLKDWLERNKYGWREKTHEGYEYVCKQYIIPYFGTVRMENLTREHIQNWINKLHTEELSVGTIRNAHRRLHAALEEAVHDDILIKNVASKPKFPATPPKKIVPYAAEEAQKLLDHAVGTGLEIMLYVALRLGLRRGELLGLLWSNVDWEKGELHITGQVQEVRGKLKRQSYSKTDKEEKKGLVIALDDDLLAAFREQQATQLAYKHECDGWQEHALIFPSAVGTPFPPRSFDRQYKRILERAGLPPKNIHNMRHTAASFMGDNGANSVQIRDVLGHTTTRMTDKYIHTSNEAQRRAIESTGRQLKRGTK